MKMVLSSSSSSLISSNYCIIDKIYLGSSCSTCLNSYIHLGLGVRGFNTLSDVNNTTTRSRSRSRRNPLSRRFHSQLQLSEILSEPSIQQQLSPTVTSASYGALLLAGGLFAYIRSGSKGSLIGGVGGSSLMALAFILMQSSETREFGVSLAFGSALLFAFVFGIRLAATRKVIPAGPLLALSIGASLVFISTR